MTDLNFPDNEPIFPISSAAKILNISVHTLRNYEKEGLIISHKSGSRQHLYSKTDLERIVCIRNTINNDKISIAGIKSILSLIPCWEINNCRNTSASCSAFLEHKQPCWLMKKKENTYTEKSYTENSCTEKDCRVCKVYMSYSRCEKIKEKIVTLTSTETLTF